MIGVLNLSIPNVHSFHAWKEKEECHSALTQHVENNIPRWLSISRISFINPGIIPRMLRVFRDGNLVILPLLYRVNAEWRSPFTDATQNHTHLMLSQRIGKFLLWCVIAERKKLILCSKTMFILKWEGKKFNHTFFNSNGSTQIISNNLLKTRRIFKN